MIERLIISRFRGIRKGVLKDLGKFNLIVGPNNSGKTAVLEVLYWLSICGRKCSFISTSLNISAGNVKIISDDEEVEPPLAFVPINKDLMGSSPCPRLWKRHGKTISWEQSDGDVLKDGTLSYRIRHLGKDEFLKDFRLIPPQTEEIEDIEKFKPDETKSICLFVLKNPRGMGDMLKYYFPDMYPDAFSYPEDKMRRFAFTWFPDFIYSKKSLGAWGVEGKTANADCVLFYDFHTTSEHFTDEFYNEILKLRGMERRLKEYFSKVFLLGDLYLFSWDEIPENGSVRLIDLLKQNYSIDWVKTAKMEKIDDGKTIKVSIEKNSLSLKLNDEKTEVNLKIDDGRTDKFIVKKENGKLNIYGDFDVSIQPYPNTKGGIQGIIKQAGMPPIPIDDFGDGARHAFKVLAALTVLEERCKDGKEGIFLWEDPELFMHPDSMQRLLTQIMDMVQDKPIQVFICTQNIEFIAYFANILKERPNLQDKSRVFRLDIREGELVSAISTYPKLKGWLENRWDPRFWNQRDTIIHYHIEKGEDEDVSGE